MANRQPKKSPKRLPSMTLPAGVTKEFAQHAIKNYNTLVENNRSLHADIDNLRKVMDGRNIMSVREDEAQDDLRFKKGEDPRQKITREIEPDRLMNKASIATGEVATPTLQSYAQWLRSSNQSLAANIDALAHTVMRLGGSWPHDRDDVVKKIDEVLKRDGDVPSTLDQIRDQLVLADAYPKLLNYLVERLRSLV
jgi:hypothetical protein